MKINVNFNDVQRKIKPMNATCCGPKTRGYWLSEDATKEFKDLSISYVRLHDVEGAYGDNQYVNIHCIFPNFDADVDDEKSYNFTPTDNYLNAIVKSGAKVFFRLGESLDHFQQKLYVRPPKDYEKWARICEHIIRHYNHGWAWGSYMEIEHWEIWNEPEGHAQWTGSFDEFIDLYTVTAKHLKKCFPYIKVGGYSAFGFYTETSARFTEDVKNVPLFRTVIPKLKQFFEAIKQNGAPLDFFSWHCYAHSPEELGECAEFIRKYLDDNGYTSAESYLTEYNTYYSLSDNPAKDKHYIAELLSGLIVAEDSSMDICFYYGLYKNSIYNGLFKYDNYNGRCVKLPPYYSMKFFSNLYRLSDKVSVDYEKGTGVYALAGKNDKEGGIALSFMDHEGKIDLNPDGFDGDEIDIVSYDYKGKKYVKTLSRENGLFSFDANKFCIYYLTFKF